MQFLFHSCGGQYPNERNVQSTSSAHDAGSHFAKKHMLSLAEGAPEWRIAKPVSPARDVDSQLARERMLSHDVPAAHTSSVLLRRAHPNGRNVEPVSFAHAAGSQFAKKHMLSHDVPHRTRRWQFVCKSAHARTGSTNRFCEGRDCRNGWSLPTLHALLRRAHPIGRTAESVSPAHDVDIQPVREHMLSHSLPTARAFFPHYPIPIVKGVWGLGPHVYHWPLTLREQALPPCPSKTLPIRKETIT